MEPPAITRRRRPFLAPIWLPALAGLLAVALGVYVYRSASTTTVVIVRHAEKALGTIDDPPLSPEGEQRSERLAIMLGERSGAGHLDAIYVTNTRRTQQSAAPLAARLHLVPVVLPALEISATAARLVGDHRGGTVLFVGHSNTIPQLVRELSGKQIEPIPDDDYGEIYVLSVPRFGSASLVRLRY
ncbi:MAG TPA: phosphoglycerate mutase family protein [Steroidobacteraceae bacterium]|jgi:broad specificity phosphatase PhoE|nr:phosphoglycerate mutase family protein [Steroidobacteraceae bacterium]